MLLIKTIRDNLLKPLQMVTGIVERKQTLPILANVIFEKNANQIIFLSFYKEMQITATAELHEGNSKNFSLTVSARKFQDILRALDQETEISLHREDEKILIKTTRNRFSLHTLPSDDFPRMTEDDVCLAEITLTQNVLKQLLSYVQYAIADQDLRYYLNGVLLSVNQSTLKTVGTDTHRLALATASALADEGASHEAILPRKTVQELLKLLNETDETVKIEFYPKKVRFTFANIVFISRIIDGQYLNYSRAIPTQNTKQLELNRLDLLHALQRVAILSNPNELFRGVNLIIENGNLRIISKNTEQEEAVEELSVNYDGDTTEICLKLPHLLDLLNHVTVETFRFSLAGASDSVLITIPDRNDFSYVIMPIKI